MSDREPPDEPEDRPGPERGGRFRRLGRRILGDPEGEPRPEGKGERSILGDAREAFGAVIEGGGQARSEVVRAVAREVRNYLDELGLKDDVKHLLTNYSFEIRASVNLRRLAESEKEPRPPKEKAVAKKASEAEEEE